MTAARALGDAPDRRAAIAYLGAQTAGGLPGVMSASVTFAPPAVDWSSPSRGSLAIEPAP